MVGSDIEVSVNHMWCKKCYDHSTKAICGNSTPTIVAIPVVRLLGVVVVAVVVVVIVLVAVVYLRDNNSHHILTVNEAPHEQPCSACGLLTTRNADRISSCW